MSLVKKHEEATVKEEQMDDAAFASGIQSVGMVDCKPGGMKQELNLKCIIVVSY